MSNTVKTAEGTLLPLMSLKGKPYMMVAHRVVWFNEEVKNYTIKTEFVHRDATSAVVKATVSIFDKEGKLLKEAPGCKSECKNDFGDFLEKAETGAIGRAITMLGYGTAYAIADLDEGNRIIDSPVVDTRTSTTAGNFINGVLKETHSIGSAGGSGGAALPAGAGGNGESILPNGTEVSKPASFRKQKPTEEKTSNGGGWS